MTDFTDRRAALLRKLADLNLQHDELEAQTKAISRQMDQVYGAITLIDELIATEPEPKPASTAVHELRNELIELSQNNGDTLFGGLA